MARHNRLFATHYLFLFTLAVLFFSVGAFAQESEAEQITAVAPSDGEALNRLWIEQGESEPGPSATVEVQVAPTYPVGVPITFACNVKCTESFDVTAVTLRIEGEDGDLLFTGQISSVLHIGDNPCQFVWTPTELADGDYTATIEAHNPLVAHIASTDLIIQKINVTALRDALRQAESAIGETGKRVAEAAQTGYAVPYEQVRTAIAEDYVALARAKIAQGEWPTALTMTRFVQRTAEGVRAQLAFMSAVPERHVPVPPIDITQLAIRNGEIRVGDRPVFLMGARVAPSAPEDMERLNRYGFRLASVSVEPRTALNTPDPLAAWTEVLKPAVQAAAANDVGVFVSINGEDLPADAFTGVRGALRETEDGTVINWDDPDVKAVLTKYAVGAADYLKENSAVVGLSVLARPEFSFRSEATRRGFVDYVRGVYDSVYEMNRAWRTNLAGFADIAITPDEKHLSYQFDWQTYHRRLVTAYLNDVMGAVRAAAPKLWLTMGLDDAVVRPGQTRYTPDFENIASDTDLTAFLLPLVPDTSSDYAMPFPNGELIYNLFRSFGMNQPLVDISASLSCPSGLGGEPISGVIRSALWENAIAGLDGIAVEAPEGAANGFPLWYNQPDCLEALAVTNLDLNRLSDWVAAFQEARADVAIVWSLPSRIHNDGADYLASLGRAYQGCAFAGRKIRFITEEQIATGGLDSVNVLVMPRLSALTNAAFEAISAYIDKGGAVIRTADRIPYSERGSALEDTLPLSSHVYLVQGIDTPIQYLHCMDAVGVEVGLPPVPHVINNYDYLLEGVRSRYVEKDGVACLYLVNLRPTSVRLAISDGISSGRDLIEGRDVQFPCNLRPLDPMLIRLDQLAERPAPKAEGPSGPPVAKVEPVSAEPEKTTPKPRTANPKTGRK